jgi:hypothetical protein
VPKPLPEEENLSLDELLSRLRAMAMALHLPADQLKLAEEKLKERYGDPR